MNIYYVSDSEAQESERDLGGWFWLKIFAEIAASSLAGAVVI